MQKDKKPVIMAETTRLMLWGFKVTLKDRRDGQSVEGYAIETGNEDYDIDVAEQNIKKKYAALGYTVTECEYDDTRIYVFDALKEYRAAEQASKCNSCVFHIVADSSVGLEDGCQIAEDEDDDDREQAAKFYECKGAGCEFYESVAPVEKKPEEWQDYLTEAWAALEELEEGEE